MIFGASTVWGAWDTAQGWVQRLRKWVDPMHKDPGFYCLVYNCGVSSESTDDILKRFETETKARSEEDGVKAIIFHLCGNDAQFSKAKNKFKVPPKRFRENVKKLIKQAKKYCKRVAFVASPLIDESKTNPISWNKDQFTKNKDLKIYDGIVESLCREKNVSFVRFDTKDWIKTCLAPDGLHANDKGHKRICEVVKHFLVKNNWI